VTPGFERRQREAKSFVERDGTRWLRSGDIGYLDEDGHLFVIGRRGDMFTVGCANVFPREIEEVLYEIDGVTGQRSSTPSTIGRSGHHGYRHA